MNKMLQTLVNELNPLRDFNDIKFYNHLDIDSLEEKWEAQKKNLSFFPELAKPIVRGGFVGGVIGLMSGLMLNYSLGDTIYSGAVVGALFDFQQFGIRGVCHYLKVQFPSSNN